MHLIYGRGISSKRALINFGYSATLGSVYQWLQLRAAALRLPLSDKSSTNAGRGRGSGSGTRSGRCRGHSSLPWIKGCTGDRPSSNMQVHALPENIFLLKMWAVQGLVIGE